MSVQSIPVDEPSSEESRTPTQEDIENGKILSPKIIAKLCRLCMEVKQTMWSFFSVLTFDDGSTIDISHVFQSVTGEDREKMENPKLPQYICEHCLDLLSNAQTFHQKYNESMQVLNEFFAKVSEHFEDVVEDIKVVIQNQTVISEGYEETDCTKNIDDTRLHSVEFISAEGESDINILPATTAIEKIAKKINTSATTIKKTDILTKNTEEAVTIEQNTTPTAKLHRCPICPKLFTALDLKKHCSTHQTLRTYLKSAPKYNKKVKFYAKPRTENKGLFNQEKIIHNCPFCQDEFESEPFRDHIKQHRSEGNFQCNICNRIFLGINHLKMHQLSHKKEAPFKCKFCKKAFFLKSNYDFHLLKHSDYSELPFNCDYCDKKFSNPEHLKRHRFSHENDMPYHTFYKRDTLYVKCKQCQQRFKSEEERTGHSCKLCCAKCHKLFDSKAKFNSHVCKNKLKTSQCLPCGKVFQLPSSLKTHRFRCKTRTLCYVCGKNVANITQHLLTHYPNKKPKTLFKCAQCNKQFTFRMNLSRHIKEVHSNIIRYQCQYCSKGFKGKWNLQVHERIHSGVKAHVCNICDKGFLEKSYLKKHLRVHLRREGLVDPCKGT